MTYRGLGGIHVLVCALGLFASGCPNPNIYGTPRTLKPGKISHTVAAEGVGYRFKRRDDYATAQGVPNEASAAVMVPPSYTLRVGLFDRFDLGVRAANLTSVGLDIKANFVKSDVLDLAIDPFVQWSFSVVDTTHLHLPLLIGINASSKFTVLLTPGIMYGMSSMKDDNTLSDLKQLMGATGLYARLGLGVDARVSPKFGLHPEVTVLKALNPPTDSEFESTLMYIFGFGFNLGAQPDYSELDEPPPSTPTLARPAADKEPAATPEAAPQNAPQ